MLVDLRRCVGCHACSVSCKTEHAVPLGSFRNRTQVLQTPGELGLSFVPMLCMHCEDAPCVNACPVSALHRRDDGRVVVDEQLCDGNQDCVRACPYDAIFLHPDTNKASKCDFCEHRTELGMPPACVEVCPTEALRFGDLSNAEDPVTKAITASSPRALKPEEETKPRVVYLGLQDWMDGALPGIQRHPEQGEEGGLTYE
jgi:tetrathionate reductase subunit B